jgi:PAS domain S-box-containing protein
VSHYWFDAPELAMSLRVKTFLIIGLTLATLTLILYALSSRILSEGFTLLEDTRMRLQVERARQQFQQEIDDLSFRSEDFTRSDMLYGYVKKPSKRLEQTLFAKESFAKRRIDFIALYDIHGTRLFVQGYEPQSDSFTTAPSDFTPHIGKLSPLITHINTTSNYSGLILLAEQPYIISSRPVLTSEGQGPVHAALVMGRAVDQKALKRIADFTRHPIEVKRCDRLNQNERQILEMLTPAEATVHTDQSGDTISGHTIMKDVFGAPALLLSVHMLTDIYKEGQGIIKILGIALAVIGAVFTVVALLTLEKMVLARLANLSKSVSAISASGDLSRRVGIRGHDELSSLSFEINKMLANEEESQQKLRESEAELRQSEERYRRVVETSPDGILVHQEDRIVFINTRGAQLFGAATPSELIGKDLNSMFSSDENGSSRLLDKLAKCEELPGTEQKIKCLDGTAVDTEVAATHCMYENKPAGLVVVRDITERKRAEQERSRIERIAASRQRLAVLGEFAAGVAHEIRNPLHGVNNCVELLRPKGSVDASDLELWDLAEEGLRRMDLISGRMLQLTRDDQGVRVPSEPARVIEESMAFVRARAQKENIHLRSEVESGLPHIVIDPVRISEALLNLLVNALDASRENGTVTVSARRRPEMPGIMEISVSDTGSGIPADIQKKVFDPFFTTKAMGKGSGLGLAITRGIVETHGGFVELISAENVGTTIKLCLPVQPVGSRVDMEATTN